MKRMVPWHGDSEETSDGGLAGWLQVVASFCLWFNSWGIVNSFGVFQSYYQAELLSDESPSNISWIGSIQAFLLLIIGCTTGPIFDAGFGRTLVLAGSILIVLGIMMTSICTTYWQIMLAQAVCTGLGAGLIYVPSVAVVPQYFSKRRAFAQGIGASGSSIAGIIYPIAFHKLQPLIGFPWATRILGFIALVTLAIPLILLHQIKLPTQSQPFINLSAFRYRPYAYFTAAITIGVIGLYVPIFYIQSYATEQRSNLSAELTFYIVPMLNASNFFGRILPSFYADKTGPLNMLIPCSMAVSILAYSWIATRTAAGIIVFSILYGFFSGAYISLSPTSITSLSPNLSLVGQQIGMCFTIASFGILVGSPISGAILNSTGSYLGLQLLTGSTLLISTAFIALARYSRVGTKLLIKS